jgi:hypothetical protein
MKPRKFKIQDTSDIERKILEKIYGPNWMEDAPRIEQVLLLDLLNRLDEMESENRALRMAMRE